MRPSSRRGARGRGPGASPPPAALALPGPRGPQPPCPTRPAASRGKGTPEAASRPETPAPRRPALTAIVRPGHAEPVNLVRGGHGGQARSLRRKRRDLGGAGGGGSSSCTVRGLPSTRGPAPRRRPPARRPRPGAPPCCAARAGGRGRARAAGLASSHAPGDAPRAPPCCAYPRGREGAGTSRQPRLKPRPQPRPAPYPVAPNGAGGRGRGSASRRPRPYPRPWPRPARPTLLRRPEQTEGGGARAAGHAPPATPRALRPREAEGRRRSLAASAAARSSAGLAGSVPALEPCLLWPPPHPHLGQKGRQCWRLEI